MDKMVEKMRERLQQGECGPDSVMQRSGEAEWVPEIVLLFFSAL